MANSFSGSKLKASGGGDGGDAPISFSLNDTAKKISESPISFKRAKTSEDYARSSKVSSEEQAYRIIDPSLSALYKELRTKQRQYREALDAFGPDDPMADVLADQVDSIRCAYETRLLEVKANNGLQAQGLALYKNAHAEHLDDVDEEKRLAKIEAEMRQWKLFNEYVQRLMKTQDQRANFLVWALLLAIMFSNKPKPELFLTQQRI